MREGFITTGDINIWYSVYGEEKAGTPLLIVHGGPGFLSMPQVVSDLADERPVYFYDQSGCGRSSREANKSRYSLENYIHEIDEVRRKLTPGPVCLMGFSWGTALIAAYMLERKPAGVKGLILCGPLLSSARWEADQRENIARMPENFRRDIEEGERRAEYGEAYQTAMIEYYKRHICLLNPWPESMESSMNQINPEVYLTMWGPSEFTVTGSLKSLDLVPRLSEIKAPVLLVCGDRDEAGVKTVKDYQMALPDARMAVIPQAAHMHHIEQPEIFKAVVRRFLDGEMGKMV